MTTKKKHLDFELNLVPFIDLLSVCICFLLITAVWLNIGSMNVKQAVGGQSADESEKRPVVWLHLVEHGGVSFDVQDSSQIPVKLRKLQIKGIDGKTDLDSINSTIKQLLAVDPQLKAALIQPIASSVYEDIVAVMDEVKKAGLQDLGIAPL